MKKFNLSDWALGHQSLVWFFMITFLVTGTMSYINLGREEDPSFTLKTMIIQANWPGASAEEMTEQVTDRIEKRLEDLETLYFTKSMTTEGRTIIMVELEATTRGDQVGESWAQVRNMIGDISLQFPAGIQGPFYNDRFGDVFGNIYAFTSDGLSQRQMRDIVEDTRSKLLTVKNIGKVEVVGAQQEIIYLEFSTSKLAALGLDQQSIITTLRAQNTITPSGVIQAGPERINVRVGGQFTSEESLRNVNLRVNDRFFPLSEVAEITRGYVDPPSSLFRYDGQPALGLAIGMKQGANLLDFGEALEHEMESIISELPVGVNVHKVSDQPEIVKEAISHFTRALFEAVAIVLAISFISLGMRAGLVVAISIPLVLAITFLIMEALGITLQRITLGALIISLGLLVDDAMIAVEMMVSRLELGDNLRKAATHVYTSTAFPMLTGTLVTVAGFMPIGMNDSAAGEFTFTLFMVIAISLIVSWVVAVLFTPLLGVAILPAKLKHTHSKRGWFFRSFSALLGVALRFRWLTIFATIAALGGSLYSLQFVQQEFFPSSNRHELIVTFKLPQNSSIAETEAQMTQFEVEMLQDNESVEYWSTYIGGGSPRFLLPFSPPQPDANVGQIILITAGLEKRDKVRIELQEYLEHTFPGTDALVELLAIGPAVSHPIEYRISGPDIQEVRRLSAELASVIEPNPNLGKVIYDWMEPIRVVKVELLQNKARQLGLTSHSVASALNGIVGGTVITQVRDGIYLVNVVSRAQLSDRNSIATLTNLQLSGPSGQAIPLASVATFHYELEQPVIWRRDRIPTITIGANIITDIEAPTVDAQLRGPVAEYTQTLPAGYKIELGGTTEGSTNAQGPIIAAFPLMLFIMATILMIQLQSFQRLFIVFAIAPFAVIGVVLVLLPAGVPLGFVAVLGVLALSGILIRNSVILIVQIEDLRNAGTAPWKAVVEATEYRMRPILLTAAAASLALIPISQDVFWGPMAYAMMGGIIVGTFLTLIFLPALYVAWFRIKRPKTD